MMMGFTQQAAEDERRVIQKELDAATARDRELDSLFERIYEDMVAGRLSRRSCGVRSKPCRRALSAPGARL